MKVLFIVLFYLSGCQTYRPQISKKSQLEFIQMNRTGRGLQLQRYDSAQIAERYKGKEGSDQLMQAIASERWDTVIDESKKHLQKFPGNDDALLLLALAYLGKGQFNLTQFYANLVVRSDAKNTVALNLLGVVHRQQALIMEDYREAIRYFNLAYLAAPQSVVPLLNLGVVHMEIGNFEASYTYFSNARKICPSCQKATLGLASAAQAMGRFNEAKLNLNEALKTDPEDPVANYLLATQTFYIENDTQKSGKMLDRTLASDALDTLLKSNATELFSKIEAKERPEKSQETGIMAH